MNNTIQHKSFRVLLALFFGFFVIGSAKAQTTAHEVSFENIESYVLNGSLHVSFDLTLEGDLLSSADALHIRPVYRTASEEIKLPSILVNGKQRARFYGREQALLSERERMENRPFGVIVRNNKERQQLSYSYVQPIAATTNTKGTLQIEQLLQDCCDLVLLDSKVLPLEYRYTAPDPALFANTVTFITPNAEQEKKRNDHFVIRIDYPVDKHEVLPNFANNSAELDRMDRKVKALFTDKETYQIEGAVIRGYASPEDTYEYNLNLSRRRTDTFKMYLVNKYGLTGLSDFPALGMGEDWEGLRKAVEASDMEHKAEVLRIIDTDGVFDGREKKLMELEGGKPYNYMLQELFPALRRMEMEVTYMVRPFNTKESEYVIEERPSGLSQREIFDLAQSKEDKDLLKIAAIYFPDNAIANINASSVALTKGNLDEAWTYLSKVEDNREAYNNLGIYFWLEGDVVKAESYFRKAIEAGVDKEKAVANMKLLEKY